MNQPSGVCRSHSQPSTTSARAPAAKYMMAPTACHREPASSGTSPTSTVPAPATAVKARAAMAAAHGIRVAGSSVNRTPGRAAVHNSTALSSSAPTIIPMPWTTNEAFITTCAGEQTSRPSKPPQPTAPRSLM